MLEKVFLGLFERLSWFSVALFKFLLSSLFSRACHDCPVDYKIPLLVSSLRTCIGVSAKILFSIFALSGGAEKYLGDLLVVVVWLSL